MSIEKIKTAIFTDNLIDFTAELANLSAEAKNVALLYVASRHNSSKLIDGAKEENAVEMIQVLLSDSEVDINYQLKQEDAGKYPDLPLYTKQKTALSYACSWGTQIEVVRALASAKAKMDAKDADGNTPFHDAAGNSAEALEILIENAPKTGPGYLAHCMQVRNETGFTPSKPALDVMNVESLKLLIKVGIDSSDLLLNIFRLPKTPDVVAKLGELYKAIFNQAGNDAFFKMVEDDAPTYDEQEDVKAKVKEVVKSTLLVNHQKKIVELKAQILADNTDLADDQAEQIVKDHIISTLEKQGAIDPIVREAMNGRGEFAYFAAQCKMKMPVIFGALRRDIVDPIHITKILAMAKQEGALKELTEYRCSGTGGKNDGKGLIHYASKKASADHVTAVLVDGVSMMDMDSRLEVTALNTALAFNDTFVLRAVLPGLKAVDMNKIYQGFTFLHSAAGNARFPDGVSILLSEFPGSFDLEAEIPSGLTALDFAISRGLGCAEDTKALIKAGAKVDKIEAIKLADGSTIAISMLDKAVLNAFKSDPEVIKHMKKTSTVAEQKMWQLEEISLNALLGNAATIMQNEMKDVIVEIVRNNDAGTAIGKGSKPGCQEFLAYLVETVLEKGDDALIEDFLFTLDVYLGAEEGDSSIYKLYIPYKEKFLLQELVAQKNSEKLKLCLEHLKLHGCLKAAFAFQDKGGNGVKEYAEGTDLQKLVQEYETMASAEPTKERKSEVTEYKGFSDILKHDVETERQLAIKCQTTSDKDSVQKFLRAHPACDVNAKISGESMLMIAVKSNTDASNVEALLRKGAKWSVTDANGANVLDNAVLHALELREKNAQSPTMANKELYDNQLQKLAFIFSNGGEFSKILGMMQGEGVNNSLIIQVILSEIYSDISDLALKDYIPNMLLDNTILKFDGEVESGDVEAICPVIEWAASNQLFGIVKHFMSLRDPKYPDNPPVLKTGIGVPAGAQEFYTNLKTSLVQKLLTANEPGILRTLLDDCFAPEEIGKINEATRVLDKAFIAASSSYTEDTKVVLDILKAHGANPDYVDPTTGQAAVHQAAMLRLPHLMMKYLKEIGAKLSLENKDHCNAHQILENRAEEYDSANPMVAKFYHDAIAMTEVDLAGDVE